MEGPHHRLPPLRRHHPAGRQLRPISGEVERDPARPAEVPLLPHRLPRPRTVLRVRPTWGGGHGIFTYYGSSRGSEGEADTNGDGIVDADERAEYVHTNVRLATDSRQNPTSERGSFDPDMVLAYNPSHVKSANLPPPQYGNLIVESNMDSTEVFIDGKSVGIVNKGTPLRLPGIAPGAYTVKGVHMGYEPDGPREVQIYPGQDTTVSARILIARNRNKAAVDRFDSGIEEYNKGSAANYKKAADDFKAALAIDPKYSQAALYLGRVENASTTTRPPWPPSNKPSRPTPTMSRPVPATPPRCWTRAIWMKPSASSTSSPSASPTTAWAGTLQSQAFARKGDFKDGRTSAEQAIAKTPKNAEAHFWLAECLRQLNQPADAEREYNQYLALSNFDSGLAGKMNYYLAGYLFGAGSKKRAAQTDIWRELRGQANLGICDAQWMEKRYDDAIHSCQQALTYIPKDLFANYRLGLVYTLKFNQQNSLSLLAAAKEHFSAVIAGPTPTPTKPPAPKNTSK